jgi:4-hydroxy-tetrahydrodipicolinate synthase
MASLRNEREFTLLCGNDRILAPAHRAGCDGVVSGVACAVPELIVALHQALGRGDEAQVRELEGDLLEFIARIERFPVPVGISAAVEARGLKVGPHALPLTASLYDELEAFKAWFAGWLPRIEKLNHARSIS